jgi:hypothetical protein
VGSGPSKVGINGAMRARDVCRPSAEDLAAAERDLVIKHAAPRGETRPLPHGITPAPLPPERSEARERERTRGRPKPRPPQR